MFVGALLPWAEGMVGLLPVRFGGFDGAADGLILAGFAIVALLFARSPDFMNAVDGARRWAPLLARPRLRRDLAARMAGRADADRRLGGRRRPRLDGDRLLDRRRRRRSIVAVVGAYATLRYHEGQTSNPTALLRCRGDPTRSRWGHGSAVWPAGRSVPRSALSIFPPVAASAPMLFMARDRPDRRGVPGTGVSAVSCGAADGTSPDRRSSAQQLVRRRVRERRRRSGRGPPRRPARRAPPDGTASSTSGA